VGFSKPFRARLVFKTGDSDSSEKLFIQKFAKEISEPTDENNEKVCG
jgi:hypothetical protein